MDASRLCRRGVVPRVVPVAAVRAALFSLLGTAVASTVHHLAFDSSPSWGVRVLAACLLFGIALPGAGQDKLLVRQLVLAVSSQAVVGYWFVRADDVVNVPAHGVWPSSVVPLLTVSGGAADGGGRGCGLPVVIGGVCDGGGICDRGGAKATVDEVDEIVEALAEVG